MIVFDTRSRDDAISVTLDGVLEAGCSELLVGQLEALAGHHPLVVDLTHLLRIDGPEVPELLVRLASAAFGGGVALVHKDLGARRSLRARTTSPVVPTVDDALSGHTVTSLGRALEAQHDGGAEW